MKKWAVVSLLSACFFSLGGQSYGQNYTIYTFAGGALPPDNSPAIFASLYGPNSVAVDSAGRIFVAAQVQNIVVRLDATTGLLTRVAGTGACGYNGDNMAATAAQLCGPSGVTVDSAGDLLIADSTNQRVRKVSNGVITTVAGTGTYGYNGDNISATAAQLSFPSGVAVDSAGNIYLADSGNQRIRMVSNGVIKTVAGTGTNGYNGDNIIATNAQLNMPSGVAVDSAGIL